jgi:hypothetical protein
MSNEPLEISVVVAATEAERTLEGCLGALHDTCEGIASELIVVHPGDAHLDAIARRADPRARVLAGPRDALVPQLWGAGLSVSRGPVVAFTTGHCIVGRGWARALLAAIADGASGAGGAIELAANTGIVDRAVYLLRYSAFLPPVTDGELPEIPGDNAAYSRSALERHSSVTGNGFWEVEFHRAVRAEGGSLVGVRAATVSFGPAFSFASIFRQRFRHGIHFGAYRVRTLGQARWRGVLASPVVPLLLGGRVLARAARHGQLGRALGALPVLLPLAGAWAAGEAWGALRVGSASPLRAARGTAG